MIQSVQRDLAGYLGFADDFIWGISWECKLGYGLSHSHYNPLLLHDHGILYIITIVYCKSCLSALFSGKAGSFRLD